MSGVNGTNGHAVHEVAPPSAIELMEAIATYKTALLALLGMVKRGSNEWRSPQDQMLIHEVERLLRNGETPPPEKKCDKK